MSTVQKLIVKGTHDELPGTGASRSGASSPLWEAVAAEAKGNPGQWVAFQIPGRDAKSLGAARTHIKAGKYRAFVGGAWDAAVRGDVLYVKHLAETTAAVVDFKKAEVA